MEYKKCQEEYQIQTEMKRDDICEIPRFPEHISLSKRKWEDDAWTPTSESELVEKWSEKYCLSDIGDMESEVLAKYREDRIHEKELIPDTECIRPKKEDEYLHESWCHCPVEIWSSILQIIRHEEISNDERESEPHELSSCPRHLEWWLIRNSISFVYESWKDIRESKGESESGSHEKHMTYARIGCDRCDPKQCDAHKHKEHVFPEYPIRKCCEYESDSEEHSSFRFVLKSDEKYPCECETDEWSELWEMLYLLFCYHIRSIKNL